MYTKLGHIVLYDGEKGKGGGKEEEDKGGVERGEGEGNKFEH